MVRVYVDLVEHGNDYSQEDLNNRQAVAIEMGIVLTAVYIPGMSSTEMIRRCTKG